VVVDGAQAVPHFPINVQDLDCDFLAFSAHKAYGPTGVGILYGKKTLLKEMPPYQGGGEMIEKVTLQHTIYNDLPYKFEAGTPNIAGIIAWQKALSFLDQIGYQAIREHENKLLIYALDLLGGLDKVKIIGTVPNKVSILSFTVKGMHHLDVGMLLDANGIAVRVGHGCTQPLIDFFDLKGIVRASFAVYNTKAEIEAFATALSRIA